MALVFVSWGWVWLLVIICHIRYLKLKTKDARQEKGKLVPKHIIWRAQQVTYKGLAVSSLDTSAHFVTCRDNAAGGSHMLM